MKVRHIGLIRAWSWKKLISNKFAVINCWSSYFYPKLWRKNVTRFASFLVKNISCSIYFSIQISSGSLLWKLDRCQTNLDELLLVTTSSCPGLRKMQISYPLLWKVVTWPDAVQRLFCLFDQSRSIANILFIIEEEPCCEI